MGTVNKQSVREEAERIKAEFDRLTASKKINNETKFFFKACLCLSICSFLFFLKKQLQKIIKTLASHLRKLKKMSLP